MLSFILVNANEKRQYGVVGELNKLKLRTVTNSTLTLQLPSLQDDMTFPNNHWRTTQ